MDIPLTAWQQAAIVALFAIIFITLIGILIRWFSKREEMWQEFQSKQQEEWRKFQDEQNRGWRETVAELSSGWQKWQAEQARRECASMDKVSVALDKLAEKLDAHDEKVDDRISRAVTSITKRGGRAQ